MRAAIVDGFNLAYRSFFAFSNLTTASGLPSGCLYGFMISLRTWQKRFPGTQFYIAWDLDASRKRSIYADYKANRVEFRADIPIQDLRSALSCMNVIQADCEGEEADDVIATLVERLQEEHDKVFIFTSDKDMLQLVRDGKVIIVRPKRGAIPEKFYDEEGVRGEFGVSPQLIPNYLALRGDKIDHVPGLPRVPSALICRLIEKYGDPADIYTHIASEKLTDFQRQAFKDFESQSQVNMALTKLSTDLNLALVAGSADPDKLTSLLDKYEIKKITADSYIKLFEKTSSFHDRTSVAVEMPSLFELA